jgi:hypothetical protein
MTILQEIENCTYRLSQNRSRAAMNLPSQTGVRFLNNLPEDIRLDGNLRKFRNRLKRFLILEELYDVSEFMDRT